MWIKGGIRAWQPSSGEVLSIAPGGRLSVGLCRGRHVDCNRQVRLLDGQGIEVPGDPYRKPIQEVGDMKAVSA